VPNSRVIHAPGRHRHDELISTIDTTESPPTSGELSNTMAENDSSPPTGRLLCALALVCGGRLISDFFPTRCNSCSSLVYMAQVHGNRRKMGPANVGKVEDEYKQTPDFRRFVYRRSHLWS
jgi:hypothetical protein